VARIFIVGSGVVGTATGRGFSDTGHDVTFIDVAAGRIGALTDLGHDARFELDLTGEPDSYIFLTLPTPNVGHDYDLTAFRAGVRDVGRALRTAEAMHTVVVRSTVPPLTAETVVAPILEQASGRRTGIGFQLASNPEFLRAASAAEDFRWPWMTVVASRNRRTAERLGELLAPFGGTLRIFADPAEAELVKCAHNIFNATKISFWNEMWLVATRLGLDHDAVAATVARSAEGSFNPEYGIRGGAPYGGVCLPKDTKGFLGFARDIEVSMPLLDAVVAVNDAMQRLVEHELAEPVPTPVELAADTGTAEPGVERREAVPEIILLPEAMTDDVHRSSANGAAAPAPFG
jgi:UDPglucose 6-dehydrogenase